MNDASLIRGVINNVSRTSIKKLSVDILLGYRSDRRYFCYYFFIVFLTIVEYGEQYKLIGKQFSDLLPFHRKSPHTTENQIALFPRFPGRKAEKEGWCGCFANASNLQFPKLDQLDNGLRTAFDI